MEMSAARATASSGEQLAGGALVSWRGDLKSGSGRLRFELGAGEELPLLWPGSAAYGAGVTSPEELMAAAHAACFTMTLAHGLARSGLVPRKIAAEGRTVFGVVAGTRTIRGSQLDVVVDAEGLEEAALSGAVEAAGHYCPVSNMLRAAGVELSVRPRLATAAQRSR